MHGLFHAKSAVISMALLALVALVLLAGSLGRLDFRPIGALGSSSDAVSRTSMSLGEVVRSAAEIPFWNQVIFWGILLLLVVLATSLLDAELRKKIILGFIRIAVFVLGFLYLIKTNPDLLAGFLDRLALAGMLNGDPARQAVPAPVFQPPQVPGWFSFAVALLLVLLMGLLLWWLSRAWIRLRESSLKAEPFADIAQIARSSLEELRSGENFENTIIECYARMSKVVDEKKGLHRENAMTPAEFSTRLARAGLPREPVEKLTGLFESSRYGGQAAGPAEVQAAVKSLTLIMHYCGERS